MTIAKQTQTTPPASPRVTPAAFSEIDFWLLTLVTVWAVNYVLMKFAIVEIGSFALNVLRFGLGTALMLGLWWREYRVTRVTVARKDWLSLVVLGVIGNTGYQFFMMSAIPLSSPSNIALIVATAPIGIALFSALLKTEQLSWRSWLGIAISFAGLYVIMTAGGHSLALGGNDTLRGDLLMLGGMLSWAMYTVLSRPFLKRYSSTTYTAWTMFTGAPLVVLMGIPQLLTTNFAAVSLSTWLIILFSATFSVAIGYVIWNAGVQQLGQSRTAIYSNLVPVIALVVSAIVLHEVITLDKVWGTSIVLIGVTITRRG